MYIMYHSKRGGGGGGSTSCFHLSNVCCFFTQIRIRLDPYHLAGSGSTSGNVDPDPGSKKNRDKLAYISNKIIIYFFLKEITYFV